jgi:hypothetical protein
VTYGSAIISIPVVETVQITLKDSLLGLYECDAGNSVVNVAVVRRKGEIGSDGGVKITLPEESIGRFELLLVLEELLWVEGLCAYAVGPRVCA